VKFGTTYPSEARESFDATTGVMVRQVTSHPSINHHPFYYLPCMDDAMQRLIFISHRTGRPEIFSELRDSGQLVQFTDHAAVAEWSVHPSHDGRYVYFTAGTGAWRVNCSTFEDEELFNFGDVAMREKGMVAAAMGTTSLSHDDRYWAVPVTCGGAARLFIIDTQTGASHAITEHGSICHPEFHPSDNTLLRFGGSFRDRIWVINRDGSDKRLVHQRRPYGDGKHYEWIVHETWRPGSCEIITANWPKGCLGIDVLTGKVRQVCSFNAWHASINRQGTLMCADTTFPDRGLQLFDPVDGLGEPHTLCQSHSSNEGAHWDTPYCPYDDGPVKVHAPQHTHPHPSFAPDGKRVVFTSDRTGHSQVYEVSVAQET